MCAIIRATERPLRGNVLRLRKRPSLNAESRMIACLPTAEKAMFCAVRRLDAAKISARPMSSGWLSAHCSTCMPPSDPPTTAAKRSMPR